tara:strand:- start:155 stop:361 length:207 start_codon:yes stop_codon:yes gene_type:complete
MVMKKFIWIIVFCLSSSLVQAKQIPTLEAKINLYNFTHDDDTKYLDSIQNINETIKTMKLVQKIYDLK